jgi:hypothetical protein
MAIISSRPEVQARAHAELDSVVGRDGWPSAEDEHRLPYIRAIIKEVRYENLAIYCLLLNRGLYLRWSVSARRFGYRRRTIQQKTLYTTGCTFRRTQR